MGNTLDNRRRCAFIRRDEGFSLSELIVVLGLLGVVLAGIYSFAFAVTSSARISEFQATAARETGAALWIVEKNLMQEIRIEPTPASNRIQFITDSRLDGDLKRHRIEATADGRIVMSTWETARTTGWPNVGAPTVAVLANNSANVADGVPLFTYYKRDGEKMEGSDIAEGAGSDTRSVEVNIRVRVDDRVHDDSRFIVLRNRE